MRSDFTTAVHFDFSIYKPNGAESNTYLTPVVDRVESHLPKCLITTSSVTTETGVLVLPPYPIPS